MSEILTHQHFAPHVGTAFTIHTADHDEVLTLTAVEPGQRYMPEGRESFALVFNGSSNDMMFHSQMVIVTHAEMGAVELLISPFGRNDDGTYRYESIFN